MARSRKFFAAGAVGVAAVALIAASTSVTGAYFTEAAPGNITGNIGAVHLTTTNTTFTWSDMMPGEQKSARVDFTNAGTGPQDFYLVFPNVPALHALNNLGKYGEVHITGGQVGNTAPLFDSANLSDDRPDATGTCGGFTPAGCWPLPTELKLASNVAPNAQGTFTFTFNYASKLGKGTSGGVGVFNSFPSPGAVGADAASSGSGLPYKIVATQVGHSPTE